MIRLRLLFVALGVALLAPTLLLTLRALEGVAAERASRERTLAERVFDEMERSLSAFLAAEESRPYAGYLRDTAPEPFVLTRFEVEGGGRIRTAPATPELGELLRGHLLGLEDADDAPEVAERDQAPGTTLALEAGRRERLRSLGYIAAQLEEQERELRKSSASPAYDAIQSLNRGALARSAREPKMVLEEAPAADAARADLSDEAASEAGLASPPPAEPTSRSLFSARNQAETAGRAAKRERANSLRITVDPLHGRRLDAQHLLLQRTVWIGELGTRQGLLVKQPALTDWLRRGVLDPLQLPNRVVFARSGEPAPGFSEQRPWPERSARLYRHRFAEPFQDLSALLDLPPLAEGRGPGTIYALSLLVVLAVVAGLFALYRMVAVTVAFAERRSNFVAAVSHELRTPLTAIRMYGEMLRDGMVPEESKKQEYYRTITAESERLSRLINNVLEFSHLEKGSREVQLVAGDLGALVAELVEVVKPHAEREGFQLNVALEAGLPPVRFDRDALLQILFNLVDNALKYAGTSRERSIEIACRRAGEGVELLVRDHGPGVAARHLGRVFEPFYRGEDELTRTTKGTGLGLALVRGLAERMGAATSGRNAQGGGLEVRLLFPAGTLAG